MRSKRRMQLVLAVAVSLFLAACTSGKETATAAIKAAEDALSAARSEAVKFVPDQVKGIDDAIRAAKASFDRGDYKEALAAAQAIPDRVKEMNAAVAVRKENLARNWAEISGGVPEMLEAIKGRLDTLKAGKRLTAPMDKTRLEQAEMRYEIATILWDEAKKTLSEGNPADVMPLAAAAREDAVAAMKLLELQVPAAAK
ncbi:MAG: hypothetical protein GXY78_06200 [Deltaproteobacteria bacterium]|nr:hypothetical protein [Deltaproteobacteria bacterium]HPX02010.1 hypothetical protein [Syntrophales bacterium]